MRPRLSLVTIVTLFVLLVGCSSARLGYSTLPSLMTWRIDRELALDDDQRLLVKERVAALQRWHRTNELPLYADFLGAAAVLPTPVSEATVAGWRMRLVDAWQPVAERVAPDLAALALTLRDGQIAHMSRRFAEANEELRRDWGLDAGSRPRAAGAKDPVVEARIKRYRERAEFFLGDLSDAQLQVLRRQAQSQPPIEADWLAEREARQQGLVELLRRISAEQPAPVVAEAWARDWLSGVWRSRDPQRAERLAAATAASDRLSAEMLNLASPGQREKMAGRLRGWAEDFTTLAAR